jgi:hypothetical protein
VLEVQVYVLNVKYSVCRFYLFLEFLRDRILNSLHVWGCIGKFPEALPQWQMRQVLKVTLPQVYCISLPHDTTLWTHIAFTQALFNFVSCFICDGWQNQELRMHQVLYGALYICYGNPWNVLLVFWRTSINPDQGFWMTFTFQMLRTHPQGPLPNIHELAYTIWIGWSLSKLLI